MTGQRTTEWTREAMSSSFLSPALFSVSLNMLMTIKWSLALIVIPSIFSLYGERGEPDRDSLHRREKEKRFPSSLECFNQSIFVPSFGSSSLCMKKWRWSLRTSCCCIVAVDDDIRMRRQSSEGLISSSMIHEPSYYRCVSFPFLTTEIHISRVLDSLMTWILGFSTANSSSQIRCINTWTGDACSFILETPTTTM